jgi:ribose transport system ATP-binding protein
VVALDDVTFDLRAGEVHVLVGENGAGKSTLVKILSGIYQPDEGQILLDGAPVTLPDPHAAQELGISTVHQELNLVPHLDVGRKPASSTGPRSTRARRRSSRRSACRSIHTPACGGWAWRCNR